MVVLDIYGKIEDIVISKKLGVIISNLPEGWQEDLVETMEEEIARRKYFIKKENSNTIKEFNIKNICQIKFKDCFFANELSEEELLKQISRHMIGIQTLECEESMLKFKNNYIDSPTCEKEFCEKLVDFFNFIITNQDKENNCSFYYPTWIYSSERSIFNETQVLNYLSFNPPKPSETIAFQRKQIHNEHKINDLIRYGQMIDSFLETENDFWKLDYIINSIFDDNNYNSHHLFKVVSLIEMLLVYPNNNGKITELDTKLQQFTSKQIPKNKQFQFCALIRQMRNKIGHGDFFSMNQKCEEYANEFMQNFWFDYYEFSRQNWILSNICINLNTTLANIIWMMLNNKDKLLEIQMEKV